MLKICDAEIDLICLMKIYLLMGDEKNIFESSYDNTWISCFGRKKLFKDLFRIKTIYYSRNIFQPFNKLY